MKPYNEQEFNRLCAEFIGLECHEPSGYWTLPTFMDGDGWTMTDMKFHSDWNWIMEVWEKIKLIPNFDHFYTTIKLGAMRNMICSRFWGNDSKEAVIQAIWQFLNWYNEQKQ